jgi:transposase
MGLNRRERRKLKQRLFSPDPGLRVVNPNAAGIDVGNESHYGAIPSDRDGEPVRQFASTTAGLKELRDWLLGSGIDTVAMQATGVYWIALCDLLEQAGIRVVVANAEHTKNVPGRKTDVQECQWLMKLHTFGLLRDSFRVDEQLLKIRRVWRLRARHVEEASRAVQHMQKALTTMNVQLANVISDISGLTGRAIINAILAGERDPHRLAELRHRRIRASQEEIAQSLEGNWREDLLFELAQARDSYDFGHRQIQQCDEQLKRYTAELPKRVIDAEAPEANGPPNRAATRRLGM